MKKHFLLFALLTLISGAMVAQTFVITTNVIPLEAGTVNGGGTYPYGAMVTLTATNNYGYTFSQWSDGNTDNPRQITVTQNATYTAEFTPNVYTITTNVTPTGAGTVTGEGTYNYGTTCTLTATENQGYTFINWTKNGTVVSTNLFYTFTVTESVAYVAHFAQQGQQYTITTNVTPSGSGVVTGGGTYPYGSQIILTATANYGYTFSHWSDGNTQNPRQVTVTGDATYTASFAGQIYIITVNADPVNGGTVTGGGAFHYGETPTLYAYANSGYTFQSWNDGNTEPVRQITVTGNATYTAFFVQQGTTTYNVTATVSPDGVGTVSGTGVYSPGAQATLTATPTQNSHYHFDHWQDGNTQNPRTVTVNSNLAFTAYFVQDTYTITTNVVPAGTGTVTGGGNNFHYGDQATLTATPTDDYLFDHWQDGNMQNPRTITVTGNATYTAYFVEEEAPEYTINVNADPADGGVVTGGGTYPAETQVTLTATENPGYFFDHWNDGNTQPQREITVTSNATYTAYFERQTYTIETSVVPEGSGEVTGGGTYPEGTEVQLTANPNQGYAFDRWNDNVTENPRTIIVTGDVTYTASFTPILYTIHVVANSEEGGHVELDNGGQYGQYMYGAICIVSATPIPGFTFIDWRDEDGTIASTEPVYSFVVTGDRALTAIFAAASQHIVYVEIDPSEGGTATGAGVYDHEEECILKAFAKPDYTFVNWTRGSEVVCEVPTYTFIVTETAQCVAHFEKKKYTIIATSDPSEGGTIIGDGQYYSGTTCTLIATPNFGYTFSRWTNDGTIISTSDTYSFTVTDNCHLTAHFDALTTYTISAMSGANGSITPQGDVVVVKGADQTFVMTPDLGGRVIKVMVDGIDIGPVESFTFTNINRNHTIYVSFSGMGVEEAQSLEIDIYPNPAKDKVFVEGEGIETVALFDMLGNCLRNMDYNTSKELNVSDLPRGAYILKLMTQDGRIGYQKLVLY